MVEIVKTKLRRIGTSFGVIIPNEKINDAGIDLGSDIEIVIVPHKKNLLKFGVAKDFKKDFKRDKKN